MGYSSHWRRSAYLIDWPVVEEHEMFSGESSVKIDVLVFKERRDPMSVPKTREQEKKSPQDLKPLQQKPYSPKCVRKTAPAKYLNCLSLKYLNCLSLSL